MNTVVEICHNGQTMLAFHPGYYIQEIIDDKHTDVNQFALFTGIEFDRLNNILHGRRRLDVEDAAKLAQALQTSMQYWLNLQHTFDQLTAQA